jgi:hypothetical protein
MEAIKMGLFKKRQPEPETSFFDPAIYEAVIRSSICTGEKTAGFRENGTGRFHDVMLITSPADLAAFSTLLDQKLQEINSDYEAKRFKDITLQQLEIVPARHGLFHDWLKQCGKLGGQHKVPRLSNSRESIDQLLVLNRQH